MLTKNIEINEAQQQFAEIIALVQNGTEVMLFDNSQPRIRLVPVPSESKSLPVTQNLPPRILGLHEGQGWISEDFDEPLPDEFWLGT